jgi:hypothetical protein
MQLLNSIKLTNLIWSIQLYYIVNDTIVTNYIIMIMTNYIITYDKLYYNSHNIHSGSILSYSTVTLLAKFLGLSTSQPF